MEELGNVFGEFNVSDEGSDLRTSAKLERLLIAYPKDNLVAHVARSIHRVLIARRDVDAANALVARAKREASSKYRGYAQRELSDANALLFQSRQALTRALLFADQASPEMQAAGYGTLAKKYQNVLILVSVAGEATWKPRQLLPDKMNSIGPKVTNERWKLGEAGFIKVILMGQVPNNATGVIVDYRTSTKMKWKGQTLVAKQGRINSQITIPAIKGVPPSVRLRVAISSNEQAAVWYRPTGMRQGVEQRGPEIVDLTFKPSEEGHVIFELSSSEKIWFSAKFAEAAVVSKSIQPLPPVEAKPNDTLEHFKQSCNHSERTN